MTLRESIGADTAGVQQDSKLKCTKVFFTGITDIAPACQERPWLIEVAKNEKKLVK